MKRLVAVSVLLFVFMCGCASKVVIPPEDPAPAKIIEGERGTYRPGYTILAYDRPDLVGRIAAAPGHVLTTEPNQDYSEVSKQHERQAKDKKRTQEILAFQKKRDSKQLIANKKESVKPLPKHKKSNAQKESDWQRAWRHYCANGVGMTDQDIEIIKRENYIVPAEFDKNCFPPK